MKKKRKKKRKRLIWVSSLEVPLVQHIDVTFSNKLIGSAGHGVQGKLAIEL